MCLSLRAYIYIYIYDILIIQYVCVNEQVRSTTLSYKLDSNSVCLINDPVMNTNLGLVIKWVILL